jgi:hypothetical protein
MLLSSLQEAATAVVVTTSSLHSSFMVQAAPSFQLDDAYMANVAIDDAATADVNING